MYIYAKTEHNKNKSQREGLFIKIPAMQVYRSELDLQNPHTIQYGGMSLCL